MSNTEKIEDLEFRVLEAEEKLKTVKNSVDKAVLVDTIKNLKAEIDKMKFTEEKRVVQNKDVPSRLDHVDNSQREISRGEIANSGNTFITTI